MFFYIIFSQFSRVLINTRSSILRLVSNLSWLHSYTLICAFYIKASVIYAIFFQYLENKKNLARGTCLFFHKQYVRAATISKLPSPSAGTSKKREFIILDCFNLYSIWEPLIGFIAPTTVAPRTIKGPSPSRETYERTSDR